MSTDGKRKYTFGQGCAHKNSKIFLLGISYIRGLPVAPQENQMWLFTELIKRVLGSFAAEKSVHLTYEFLGMSMQ